MFVSVRTGPMGCGSCEEDVAVLLRSLGSLEARSVISTGTDVVLGALGGSVDRWMSCAGVVVVSVAVT